MKSNLNYFFFLVWLSKIYKWIRRMKVSIDQNALHINHFRIFPKSDTSLRLRLLPSSSPSQSQPSSSSLTFVFVSHLRLHLRNHSLRLSPSSSASQSWPSSSQIFPKSTTTNNQGDLMPAFVFAFAEVCQWTATMWCRIYTTEACIRCSSP